MIRIRRGGISYIDITKIEEAVCGYILLAGKNCLFDQMYRDVATNYATK